MTSDVITLRGSSLSQNAFGAWTETSTEKTVPCKVESVTRAEFFEAAKIGLNPQWRFTVFSGDYTGENACVYQGTAYAIYRTYKAGDYMELYAAARAGATNG